MRLRICPPSFTNTRARARNAQYCMQRTLRMELVKPSLAGRCYRLAPSSKGTAMGPAREPWNKSRRRGLGEARDLADVVIGPSTRGLGRAMEVGNVVCGRAGMAGVMVFCVAGWISDSTASGTTFWRTLMARP
jgi:hypothetical protein